MAKKLILGPILAHLAQIWAPKNFFVGFTYTRRYTLLQAIIAGNFMRKWQKSFRPDFGLFGPNLGLKKFFRKFYF